MSNSMLISIIVPVYNAEEYLPKCIDSIRSQTYENIEIICINDGSEDKSQTILERYSMQDSRIRVFTQKNKGVSSARNLGISKMRGEYVLFVDSDDWLDENVCESAVGEAVQYSADVVLWPYKREYSEAGKETYLFEEKRIVWTEDRISELHRRMIGLVGKELAEPHKVDAAATVWGKLYKSTIVQRVQFVDTNKIGTAEDSLYNIMAFDTVRRAVYISNVFYHYRKNNKASMTHSYKRELIIQWKQLYYLIWQHLREINAPSIYYEALNNRICSGIMGLGLNLVEDNNMTTRKKIQELRKILSVSYYERALRKMSFTYLPVHWRVFYLCSKCKMAISLYLILCIMNCMRGR